MTLIADLELGAAKAELAVARAEAERMQDIIAGVVQWCKIERMKKGAIDGYDYHMGERDGLRRAAIEIDAIVAHAPKPPNAEKAALTEKAGMMQDRGWPIDE